MWPEWRVGFLSNRVTVGSGGPIQGPDEPSLRTLGKRYPFPPRYRPQVMGLFWMGTGTPSHLCSICVSCLQGPRASREAAPAPLPTQSGRWHRNKPTCCVILGQAPCPLWLPVRGRAGWPRGNNCIGDNSAGGGYRGGDRVSHPCHIARMRQDADQSN